MSPSLQHLSIVLLFCLTLVAKSFSTVASVPFHGLSNPVTSTTCSDLTMSVVTVQKWMALVDADKFEEAANMMHDDVTMKSPGPMGGNLQGKEAWKEKAPKVKKDGPVWGKPEIGSHDKQVVMSGTKKLGFISMSCKRTIELDSNGLIKSILAQKS